LRERERDTIAREKKKRWKLSPRPELRSIDSRASFKLNSLNYIEIEQLFVHLQLNKVGTR
jgi:hypothetical protein